MKLTFRKQMVLLLLTAGSAATFLVGGYAGEKRLSAASTSFTEMYQDRLVAEHLVYQMTELVHRQQSLISDEFNKNGRHQITILSGELEVLTDKFAASKLSPNEKVVFGQLKNSLNDLALNVSLQQNNATAMSSLVTQYTEALSLLGQLADIQIKEGTKLNKEGQVALASSAMGLKFQSALFIVFVFGLLALLKSIWIKSKVVQRHELN